ncbi:class I SAM-dependent methyltransferase, partial [Candidatus Woesearchaeota archaeon]|nr:class I SAM-dependent methyltransferase [Candidatus Woesearchaeota archaeon]
ATVKIRKAIPALVKRFGVKSFLDVPCGDFNWMKEVKLGAVYIGGDIVPDLIDANNKRYASEDRSFMKLDITRDRLPKADMVMCRDCLVHLSFKDILKAVKNMKRSGAKYLLTTTFPGVRFNQYIETGEWRVVNLEKPPFSFPKPIVSIHEAYHTDRFGSKSLALWKIEELPVFDASKHFYILRIVRIIKNILILLLNRARRIRRRFRIF